MRYSKATLAQLYNGDSKSNLLDRANWLAIPIDKSLKKSILAPFLAQTLLNNPMMVLERLSMGSLLKLQSMLHSNDTSVPVKSILFEDCNLRDLGISDLEKQGGKYFEFVYEDVQNAFTPIIDDYIIQYKQSKIYKKRQLVFGLINLYGILELSELESLYKKYTPHAEENELQQIIEGSLLFIKAQHIERRKKKLLYASPYIINYEEIKEKIAEYKSPAYTDFTEQEVRAAGNYKDPFPILDNIDHIYEAYKSLGVSAPDARQLVSRIWVLVNNQKSPIDMVLGKVADAVSGSMPNTGIMIDSSNYLIKNMPLWQFKGNSHDRIFIPIIKKQRGPNNSIIEVEVDNPVKVAFWHQLANDSMKNRKPALTEEKPVVNPPAFDAPDKPIINLFPKIGRNDPCPCGSKKKYKHCCGNN